MAGAALSLAVFVVVVGIGQMFVVTLGPGNVDLSLPANIGLASAVAMKVMGGDDARVIAVGLAAATGQRRGDRARQLPADRGCCASRRSSPPCRRASSSSRSASATGAACRSSRRRALPTAIKRSGRGRVAPRAWRDGDLGLCGCRAAPLCSAARSRHRPERAGGPPGQHPGRADPLLTYVLSGALGGLSGALLAGYFRGASLDIGNEYLLTSIAVVVIGGTSVAAARPTSRAYGGPRCSWSCC